MSETKDLKKENKKLKKLLKNAVELLNKSKKLMEQHATPSKPAKIKQKKTVKKLAK